MNLMMKGATVVRKKEGISSQQHQSTNLATAFATDTQEMFNVHLQFKLVLPVTPTFDPMLETRLQI